MCGVYLITIVAAIRVHVRSSATATLAAIAAINACSATGSSWRPVCCAVGSLTPPRPGPYRRSAHFVRLFYAQLLLNILQKADIYIYAFPNWRCLHRLPGIGVVSCPCCGIGGVLMRLQLFGYKFLLLGL